MNNIIPFQINIALLFHQIFQNNLRNNFFYNLYLYLVNRKNQRWKIYTELIDQNKKHYLRHKAIKPIQSDGSI